MFSIQIHIQFPCVWRTKISLGSTFELQRRTNVPFGKHSRYIWKGQGSIKEAFQLIINLIVMELFLTVTNQT